ncbi:MAG: hypothetical protein WCF77_04045 [Minisyncoccia bacterium]
MSILIIISIIVFAILCALGFFFPSHVPFLNFIVPGLTLIVLVWYAYDTHRIANQTLESNLQPVVLRSGYISNWASVQFTIASGTISGTPISFMVLKNIAKDISGHIVLNNQKYTLLFGNSISQIAASSTPPGSTQPLVTYYSPTWGWLAPNNTLYANFDPTKFQQVRQDNEIYIEYKDIENNRYYTMEDKDFSSTSGPL